MLIITTKQGKVLKVDEAEIPQFKRKSVGVNIMTLKEGDEIVSVVYFKGFPS